METTLSQKKQDLLFNAIHKSCMDARVETIMYLRKNNLPWEEIDNIFYKLCTNTPKKALECFKKKL